MYKTEKFTRFLVRIALAGACVMPLASLSLQAQSGAGSKNQRCGIQLAIRFRYTLLLLSGAWRGHRCGHLLQQYSNWRIRQRQLLLQRRLGLEAAFEAHPDGNNDGLYDVEAGPIVRDNMNHFSLFAHGLIGMGRLVGPNTQGLLQQRIYLPQSLDVGRAISDRGRRAGHQPGRVVSLRLVQVDYTYNNVDFGPYAGVINRNPLGGRAHLAGLQASAGLVWHFGDITPPLPVSYSCSANPTTVFPGEPITVTGTAMNLNPKKTATYSWTSSGGAVNGSSSTVTVSNKTPEVTRSMAM